MSSLSDIPTPYTLSEAASQAQLILDNTNWTATHKGELVSIIETRAFLIHFINRVNKLESERSLLKERN